MAQLRNLSRKSKTLVGGTSISTSATLLSEGFIDGLVFRKDKDQENTDISVKWLLVYKFLC